jgi:hypothetical protein
LTSTPVAEVVMEAVWDEAEIEWQVGREDLELLWPVEVLTASLPGDHEVSVSVPLAMLHL